MEKTAASDAVWPSPKYVWPKGNEGKYDLCPQYHWDTQGKEDPVGVLDVIKCLVKAKNCGIIATKTLGFLALHLVSIITYTARESNKVEDVHEPSRWQI